MGAIGRELVRIARERVIMYERALDNCHPDDQREREELTRRLNEERAKLRAKSEMLNEEENGGSCKTCEDTGTIWVAVDGNVTCPDCGYPKR